MTDDALAAMARDTAHTAEVRRQALVTFVARNRTEAAASDLILELMHDAVESIVLAAIAVALPFDIRQRERMTALLDDDRPAVWQAAAEALARRKERALLPRFTAWAMSPDSARRRAGLLAVCWIVNPHERLHFLKSAWEGGWPRDDAERILVAEQLVNLRDELPKDWLAEAAAADDEYSDHACRLFAMYDT
jgi:hypothetical protein